MRIPSLFIIAERLSARLMIVHSALAIYTFQSVDVGIRQKICSRILHDVA